MKIIMEIKPSFIIDSCGRTVYFYHVIIHTINQEQFMNRKYVIIFIAAIVVYFILKYISGFYIDFEWFKQNGGLSVFWVLFMTRFNVQALFGTVFIVLFLLNFLMIRLLGGKGRFFAENFLDRIQIPAIGSSRKLLLILVTAVVVFTGFIMGSGASAFWKE